MDENRLIYPNLNLFLYDVCSGLGEQRERLQDNRLRFWSRIKPELNSACQTLHDINHKRNKKKAELEEKQKSNTFNQAELLDLQEQIDRLNSTAIDLKEKIDIQLEEFAGWEDRGRDLQLLGDAIDFPSPLDGYYDPVQLGDTYGLLVNYSGKKVIPNKDSNSHEVPAAQSVQTLSELRDTIAQHIAFLNEM